MDEAFARARRDHPLRLQQTTFSRCGAILRKTVIFVPTSCSVVYLLSQRVLVMTPTSGTPRRDIRIDVPERGEGVSHLGRIRRLLPRRFRPRYARWQSAARIMTSLETPLYPLAGRAAGEPRARGLVRNPASHRRACGGIALWSSVVRLNNIPPYVLVRRPVDCFERWISDWPVLREKKSASAHASNHAEGLLPPASRRRAGAVVQQIEMAGIWNIRCFPMRWICRVTPVIASRRFLLIYLRSKPRSLSVPGSSEFSGALQQTSSALNSVDRNLAGLVFQLSAPRDETLR